MIFRFPFPIAVAVVHFLLANARGEPQWIDIDENSTPPHYDSIVSGKKSNLRSKSDAINQHHLDAVRHSAVQVSKLSEEEHLEMMESLRTSMETIALDMESLDLSAEDIILPSEKLSQFHQVQDLGKEHVRMAMEATEDAISLFKTLHEEESKHTTQFSDELQASVYHRRLDEMNENGPNRDQGNWKRRTQEDDQDQSWQKSRRYSGSSYHKSFPFQQDDSHHTRRIQEIHEAVRNGDFHGAFSAFGSTTHQPRTERRRGRNSRRRLDQQDQCQVLAECVMEMSLYDTFMFYYADDLVPATGKLDSNILRFDERNIARQYLESRTLAERILSPDMFNSTESNSTESNSTESNSTQSTECDCDLLLQQFHRTIEAGGIPEWEGASVNQVCLAVGSTDYIKFGEIANALVESSFSSSSGFDAVSEAAWVDNIASVNENVTSILVEPFQCAEELFYAGPRENTTEQFPFGEGCRENSNSNESIPCTIDQYRFPIALDLSTNNSQDTTYVALARRSSCDAGHEILSRDECIQAGLSVGGTLQRGAPIEGSWTSTPMGCFLGDDAVIFWSTRKTGKPSNTNWKYLPICSEKDNWDLYEIVEHKTACDPGYEITTVEDCGAAGQAVGGFMQFEVLVADWGYTPCGCFLNIDGRIHFDNGNGGCANNGWAYSSVCKRQSRPYEKVRKRSRCDPGYEITSQQECIEAALSLDGILKGDSLMVGDWGSLPCGCSIQHASKHVYFDTSTDQCRNDGWGYDTVCKRNPNKDRFRKTPVVKQCETGYQITTPEECAVAGQAVGGYLANFVVEIFGMFSIDISAEAKNTHLTPGSMKRLHRLETTPCGCFLGRDGKVYFDTGTAGCANQNLMYEAVCYKKEVEHGGGRDIHGKLLGHQTSGFITTTYDVLDREANACMVSALQNLDQDCFQKSNGKQDSSYYRCRVTTRIAAIKRCDRFGPIQAALERVFGAKASSGFICEIKESVVTKGGSMPGSCCLDAPYELDGDDWGKPYNCESEIPCKNPGPFLAGINKGACSAQGGTWCPTVSNCTMLKDAIGEMAGEANAEGKHAFAWYLLGAPNITDTSDHRQCGKIRGYFGFDEFLVNDAQILGDIEGQKDSKVFDFLNEYFETGSDMGNSGDDPDPTSELVLIAPKRSRSKSPMVAAHKSWMSANQALDWTAWGAKTSHRFLENIQCPADAPNFFIHNMCKDLKGMVGQMLLVLLMLAEKVQAVANNMFNMMSYLPAAAESEENTAVMYDNMKLMANYLVEMRAEMKPGGRQLEEQGPDVGEDVDCTKQSTFQVEMEVLEAGDVKSLLSLSTLDGELVEAHFEFSAVDGTTESSVPFTMTELQPGKSIFHFGPEVSGSAFLLAKAKPLCGQKEVNHLVSFR